ncbi:MAG: hypothetical protein E2O84_03210 [Bacteroidetes bacterium]|nr:MAG: hypothetical protein E2O84_03210 [Bacteroidota bacterium]
MPVIKVAVWDDPMIEALHQSWTSESGVTIEVLVLSAEDAERAVLLEDVDIALLPSTQVLLRLQSLDILSESAISTWRNEKVLIERPTVSPPDHLFIKSGPRNEVFDLVSNVILKEHYRYSVERESNSSGHSLANGRVAGSTLSVQPADTDYSIEQYLDVSQEWYELVNYPMVWALFVTAKNNVTDILIKGIREWVTVLYSEAVDEFISDDGELSDLIRPRLDDLAIASLTELCDYMFHYGVAPNSPVFTLVDIETE